MSYAARLAMRTEICFLHILGVAVAATVNGRKGGGDAEASISIDCIFLGRKEQNYIKWLLRSPGNGEASFTQPATEPFCGKSVEHA